MARSELFYASDEAHIRVMAFDALGNLIVGTEPSGRVLRISRTANASTRKDKDKEPAAEGFVLYETSKREVTALAVAPDGNIYAAAIGEKQRVGSQATAIITNSQGTTTITGGGVITGTAQNATPFVAFPPMLSGSIYKIAPDGAPEELWTSRDDVVYSLALNADGRLLAGTGNNGALLAIDGRGVFAQLAKAGSAQITGISRGSRPGKIFLCTANPGKVFSVGPEYQPEGTYESRSFDAQLFSKSGDGSIGGVRRPLLRRQSRRRSRTNLVSSFLFARETPKIPARNGRAGSVRTRNPGRWKLRPCAVLRSGRR